MSRPLPCEYRTIQFQLQLLSTAVQDLVQEFLVLFLNPYRLDFFLVCFQLLHLHSLDSSRSAKSGTSNVKWDAAVIGVFIWYHSQICFKFKCF
jgi:hypothetical protein